MKTRLTTLVMAVFVFSVLCSGCINLGGGSQYNTAPFGDPEVVKDSSAVNAKHGTSGGQFAGTDDQRATPTADQVVTIGEYSSTAKQVDTSAATKQGVASGRETGSVDASGNREQNPGVQIPIGVGATPTVNASGAASPGGLTPAQFQELKDALINAAIAPATP